MLDTLKSEFPKKEFEMETRPCPIVVGYDEQIIVGNASMSELARSKHFKVSKTNFNSPECKLYDLENNTEITYRFKPESNDDTFKVAENFSLLKRLLLAFEREKILKDLNAQR